MEDYKYACCSASFNPCYVGEAKPIVLRPCDKVKSNGHYCKSNKLYSSAYCQEYDDGHFAYDSGDADFLIDVNFCPLCGAKAPMQASE